MRRGEKGRGRGRIRQPTRERARASASELFHSRPYSWWRESRYCWHYFTSFGADLDQVLFFVVVIVVFFAPCRAPIFYFCITCDRNKSKQTKHLDLP